MWEKCNEELQELKEALKEKDIAHIDEEFGDFLFAIVNLSRFINVDAELSLMAANKKFKKRFLYVEECVKKSGRDWKDYKLFELDEYWNEAKKKSTVSSK